MISNMSNYRMWVQLHSQSKDYCIARKEFVPSLAQNSFTSVLCQFALCFSAPIRACVNTSFWRGTIKKNVSITVLHDVYKFIFFSLQPDASISEVKDFAMMNMFPLVGHYTFHTIKHYDRLNEKFMICLIFYTIDFTYDHRKGKGSSKNKNKFLKI